MTVPSCRSAGLSCTSDVQVQCGSLFPGHHQDCRVPDANGGWLQCLDLTDKIPGSSPCRESDYGIHRDSVWVQNGCQGNFYTCYIPATPTGQIESRTLECSSKDNLYKQCKIDGAYLVNNVQFKFNLSNKTCTEGINYGIVSDSIFVKDGCNGIFTVDFFPDTVAPPPVPTRTTTTTTTTTPSPRPTTTTTFRTTTEQKSPTFSSSTVRSSTTNHTSIVKPPTYSEYSGSIVALTIAAVLGVFLVLFLATFAILWFSRRYRCTKRHLERKPDRAGTIIEGPSVGKLLPLKFNKGNIYEEISTHEEVPSAPPVYERQPFITHEFTGHECSLEPNNNPKNPLGENYFILDPKYRDCRTLPLNTCRHSNHMNFEPELFHPNPPDHRPCQIHHPVARMGSVGNHGHEPVIRMGTFNPKIHQYPLTLGPCMDQHVMHNKQNSFPVLNGKSMRISDSDVDEDGYQKIGTFGPQQKHFHHIPPNFSNIPPNFNCVHHNYVTEQSPSDSSNSPSEHCQNDDSNQPFINTSSC